MMTSLPTAIPRPQAEYDGWLAVSLEGFAAMNAGREPAHLVKELVQNALDALNGGGKIELECRVGEVGTVLVTCRDNGMGMHNLADIRTMFHTSKTDSNLQRGRMGRGFKEMLCLARQATVTSGHFRIEFLTDQAGQKVTRHGPVPDDQIVYGTLVEMHMPWKAESIGPIEKYFQGLLVPRRVNLRVNGNKIKSRKATHKIEASLPTELFESGRWIRPIRKTTIELVKIAEGEEACVYELGIPVCPMQWSAGYHVDVLQRVPMNPCRDAVASGYLTRLHRACLPTLLSELQEDQVRQDWVGAAVPYCDEETQKEVIRRGFGQNIARSVPAMGVRQFDEDAREIGTEVINTRQTSGGFRQILQKHIPTTRQVVDQHNQDLVLAAAKGSFKADEVMAGEDPAIKRRRQLIESAGGKERVELVCDFARWFCQQLLDGYEDSSVCSVTLALLKSVDAVATWNQDDVLTLGIDTPWLWSDPLGEEALGVLCHECAHHLNAHHGRDFHREMEKLAGRAARIMLMGADHVRERFKGLFNDDTEQRR